MVFRVIYIDYRVAFSYIFIIAFINTFLVNSHFLIRIPYTESKKITVITN